MTRENKLSIVIAFGLLIFVSMLVADHFSIASHREVADLGSNFSSPPLAGTTILEGRHIVEDKQPQKNKSGDHLYVVQSGETLRTICANYYGDSGLATAVARWNKIANLNKIDRNQQIALPNRSSLIEIRLSSAESTPAVNEMRSMGQYTVKTGDTLSEISQKVMGTTKKTQLLIDLNRDVMPNPDRIRPGMVLQFPIPTS
jgi:nucleoid-associated protein YgaU